MDDLCGYQQWQAGALRGMSRLIQRSAWKGYSANFALTEEILKPDEVCSVETVFLPHVDSLKPSVLGCFRSSLKYSLSKRSSGSNRSLKRSKGLRRSPKAFSTCHLLRRLLWLNNGVPPWRLQKSLYATRNCSQPASPVETGSNVMTVPPNE